MANGIPVRHYPPHRKDLAIQYATDPAYRALLGSSGSMAQAMSSERFALQLEPLRRCWQKLRDRVSTRMLR